MRSLKVAVFGKNGQVGQCLVDLARDSVCQIIGYGRADVDISNKSQVSESIFPGCVFDFVVNAAAYTSVDGAENEKELAIESNIIGPANLASACQESDIPLVHISTDYVFDGRLSQPYKETDQVNPSSTYGLTKLAGDKAVSCLCDRHVIIRTSWVFSEYGSNFVKTMLRLFRETETVQIVGDQFGGPTSASAIAGTILAICDRHVSGEKIEWGTYHFCQKPYVSWYQFAQVIFSMLEDNREGFLLSEIPSSDYKTPAIRPLNSCLDTAKIERVLNVAPRSWMLDLRQVLGTLD